MANMKVDLLAVTVANIIICRCLFVTKQQLSARLRKEANCVARQTSFSKC
jgi:hypothetical protein